MITLAKLTKTGIEEPVIEFKEEKTPLETESENVLKVLPLDLYLKVANIIGLDEHIHEKISLAKKKTYRRLYRGIKHITKVFHGTTFDRETIDQYSNSSVEPPTPKSEKYKTIKTNPYYDFFEKSEREQVRWESKYLPPETELEKGLIRRADDLTNKICFEFCAYMQSLGGYNSPMFNEEIIKKMFQIEFNTHISKGTKVCPVQMKTIPRSTAKATGHMKAYISAIYDKLVLRHHMKKDIEAEKKQIRRVAFNKTLPKTLQWTPPSNKTLDNWSQENKLNNTVTSMENVWGEITTLKSVHDFCQWIIDHPGIDHPVYLKRTGMLNKEILRKIKTMHQFNIKNRLPEIDVKMQLNQKSARKLSLPPLDVKIEMKNI